MMMRRIRSRIGVPQCGRRWPAGPPGLFERPQRPASETFNAGTSSARRNARAKIEGKTGERNRRGPTLQSDAVSKGLTRGVFAAGGTVVAAETVSESARAFLRAGRLQPEALQKGKRKSQERRFPSFFSRRHLEAPSSCSNSWSVNWLTTG